MKFLMIFKLVSTLGILCIHAHVHYRSHDDSMDHAQYEHLHPSLRTVASTSFQIGSSTYSSQKEFIDSGNRCGTIDPSSSDMDRARKAVEAWKLNKAITGNSLVSSIEIDTYFHIITAENETIGVITDEGLVKQINVLNDSYGPHGFKFNLRNTTRTENTTWYYAIKNSSEAFEMMSALRVGDASTLNVYFTNASNYLGYATFPFWYVDNPIVDGVVVLSDSIPGGSAIPYDEGKTLVHEIGHWMGLYHTFQPDVKTIPEFILYLLKLRNGCDGAGDEIRDTPREKKANFGCPIRKNSCPLWPGKDPIHNFMDYTDDVCLTEFTPDQADRMMAMWTEYRAV